MVASETVLTSTCAPDEAKIPDFSGNDKGFFEERVVIGRRAEQR
jgi:hypothetical protein